VLHAIAPVQHGIHRARPQDAIDRIFWQIWLAFVAYLTTRGAVLAGVLVAYAWYLSLLRPPQSCNSSGFLAEASPRPSQTCEPKLRCRTKGAGSRFRNEASMKLAAPTNKWSASPKTYTRAIISNVRK
jgi:hypothetical protein